MKDRMKKLRKRLDLTQQEFADRIGIARGNIGAYEVGKNVPSDAVISLICREFNVREEWLRTGEGEMFNPKPSDILDQLAQKYKFSSTDYAVVEKFISLKPEKRKEIFDNVFSFLHEVEAALSDADRHAVASSQNEPDSIAESIRESREEADIANMTVEELEEAYKKSRSVFARKTGLSASNTIEENMKKKNA